MGEQTFDGVLDLSSTTVDIDFKRSGTCLYDVVRRGKLIKGLGKIEDGTKVKVTIKVELK